MRHAILKIGIDVRRRGRDLMSWLFGDRRVRGVNGVLDDPLELITLSGG